jgi:hypothetical protein
MMADSSRGAVATGETDMDFGAKSLGNQLESLAGMLRNYAPRNGSLGNAAIMAADQLEQAGYYLREESIQGMMDGVARLVRRYPLQSLLIGAGVGYLLSRSSSIRR